MTIAGIVALPVEFVGVSPPMHTEVTTAARAAILVAVFIFSFPFMRRYLMFMLSTHARVPAFTVARQCLVFTGLSGLHRRELYQKPDLLSTKFNFWRRYSRLELET